MIANPDQVLLSPASESYDRGAKFAQYRRLDSLREIVDRGGKSSV